MPASARFSHALLASAAMPMRKLPSVGIQPSRTSPLARFSSTTLPPAGKLGIVATVSSSMSVTELIICTMRSPPSPVG